VSWEGHLCSPCATTGTRPPAPLCPINNAPNNQQGEVFFGRKREKKGRNGRKRKEVLKERRSLNEREGSFETERGGKFEMKIATVSRGGAFYKAKEGCSPG
jgi:hypothetical protein